MSDLVLIEVDGRIAVVTLNRPSKLNALSYELVDAISSTFDDLERREDIDAVILTGAGDRAFSAGADIEQFSGSVDAGPEVAIRDFVRRGQAMTAKLEAFAKPVIAAVNGIAFGGGCEIVEAVHLTIASDRATFAKPEIRLNMPPTFGGTQRLPRLVGRKRALEFLLSGDPFDAVRALEFGLVNDVVPHEELLPAALRLAERVTRHSPRATASILHAVTRGINLTIAEGLQVETEQFARMASTLDLREGLDSWLERGNRRAIGSPSGRTV